MSRRAVFWEVSRALWIRKLPSQVAALAAPLLILSACSSGSPSASQGDATGLQQTYIQVVKEVAPSVVQIRDSVGIGSGIAFDDHGDILTNNHVVAGASGFQVLAASGKVYPAQLVGAFAPGDVAVLRVQASGLRPATFADSRRLQVGQIVLAIGSPLGLASSVTQGIVSATGRTVNEPNGNAIPNAVQTNAAINPGNSGGALVGLDGHVVGVPTLAAVDPEIGGSAPGIGFAIPSHMAKDIATQLVQYGRVVNSHRAYLGAEVGNTSANAVLVVSVQPGGPAAKAGIHPGDLIVAANGTPTPSPSVLEDVLANLQPGGQMTLAVVRTDGSHAKVQVTLGQYPGGAG